MILLSRHPISSRINKLHSLLNKLPILYRIVDVFSFYCSVFPPNDFWVTSSACTTKCLHTIRVFEFQGFRVFTVYFKTNSTTQDKSLITAKMFKWRDFFIGTIVLYNYAVETLLELLFIHYDKIVVSSFVVYCVDQLLGSTKVERTLPFVCVSSRH